MQLRCNQVAMSIKIKEKAQLKTEFSNQCLKNQTEYRKEKKTMRKEYKLIAPDINRLIGCYSHEIQNPEQPSLAMAEALDPLFKAMENLAPSVENDEAKGIWVTVPRGKITDWRTYKAAL